MPKDKIDNVNHPPHYETSHPTVQAIVITERFNFCLGNCIKYVWRAGFKEGSDPIGDLKKARWYLDREIERREREDNP